MAADTSVIGKQTTAARVVVESGPVGAFAAAVKDDNPIFRDVQAARDAGFDNIPVPPTWTFVQSFWNHAVPQPPDPTGGDNPMHKLLGELFGKGALVLHGEQEFEYHRQIVVGDTLVGEGTITDVYEKDSASANMTFVVVSTEWRDEKTGEPVVTERFNLIARLKK